jgi:membrane protease YdiL (CAAX protease family)
MSFKKNKTGAHTGIDDDLPPGVSTEMKRMDKESGITHLPNRYAINDSSAGRVLICLEAPNISVRVETGLTISASAARRSSSGTIYLDGAAQCEPFMDNEKQIYNFDHHEGCIRPFTLSTCEQVLVMILKGMDLRDRKWSVFANEPDLDTILAIWLILNHLRIRNKDSERLRFLYAVVRLEGIIDSHGLEITEFSGLPPRLYKKAMEVIDYLRLEEIDLKKSATWEKKDNFEYTALILQKIDSIIYRSEDFLDFTELKELARVELACNRIAIVIEADQGIYELEASLQRVYGERLGLAILKKGESLYTLRRLDPFMPGDLSDVYPILNYMDPVVRSRKNSNQWGGSGDIGGSPRGIPTKLSPVEIAHACRDAFQNPSAAVYSFHFFYAMAVVCAITGAAFISNLFISSSPWFINTAAFGLISKTYISFFVALIIFTALCVVLISRMRLWQFGIRVPVGKDWWILLPVIVLSAMGNGVYFPYSAFYLLSFNQTILYILIAIPLASELLFRGLAYGILAEGTSTKGYNSRWFLSYPVVASAILYTSFIICLVFLPKFFNGALQLESFSETAFAAFTFGLANGIVRERSHSILPAILFHTIAIAVFLF